jgi:tetratricopeptide (TPR) repeat protein
MKRPQLPQIIGGAIGILLFLLLKFVPAVREALGELYRRPYLMFIALGAMALFFLPRYRKSARLNDEGVKLLSQGHVFAALEKFMAARPLAQSPVLTTFNIGVCRLYLWQLEEAERELSRVQERENLTPQFRGILMAPFALVAALEGRLREAFQRLDEARELKSDSAAEAVLASAVLACRRGNWAGARELLEREQCLSLLATSRGLRDALLAWSVERLTGERRRVDPLAVFGEASPDKLQAAWPELVAFILAEHQEVKAKAR